MIDRYAEKTNKQWGHGSSYSFISVHMFGGQCVEEWEETKRNLQASLLL